MFPSNVYMIKGNLRQLFWLLLQVPPFLHSLYIKLNQKDLYITLHFYLTSKPRSQLINQSFQCPSTFFISQLKRRNLATRKSSVF